MKLLKTIVKNFQSLAYINLDHGDITVLFGQSDVGKSALMRAIRMLHRNSGSSGMVKDGTDSLKVFQKFDTGDVVGIEKGDGVNKYVLKFNESETKTLSKVGKDVPDVVESILQTYPLQLDKDQELDLNFCMQFDPIFLLTDSTTTVTKAISSISGINIIYTALREGGVVTLRLKNKIGMLEETVKNLEPYETMYLQCTNVEETHSKLDNFKDELEQKLKELQSLENMAERLNYLIGKKIEIQPISDIHVKLQAVLNSMALDHNFIVNTEHLLNRIVEFVDFEDSELTNIKISKLSCLMSVDALLSYNVELKKLMNFENILSDRKNSLDLINKELPVLLNEEVDLKSKIKVCETCGRPL